MMFAAPYIRIGSLELAAAQAEIEVRQLASKNVVQLMSYKNFVKFSDIHRKK